MNPSLRNAHYYSMVFTENKPEETLLFEQDMDGKIRKQFRDQNYSRVFIKYQHDLGGSINNFSQCLNHVEKFFGDLGRSSLTFRKMQVSNIGQINLISWKNQSMHLNNLILNN
jgi:hypothetical protein